ncbi:histidine phosphatase family protein [Pseudonocardia bannensis]|uniref:Histidine phosphatase family protein n=1 Tax=Pseudonocardia bannensis TaxID=630973 RepID=A0A848DNE4_9PSEU|nr:histidine phosphatase family protein [Pseudonocardia bannensis]NMH94228.1 histidine phosphatase family protein [Pseudonocardia bannensis]
MLPGPVTLHLVRHGESTWNAAGRLQGHTPHVPLTARGRAQAAATAAVLAARPVVAVLSSDLLRARQSAAPIAAAHGLPVRAEPALREQSHGIWEGRPVAGYAARLAAAPDPDWAPPGGESARALHTRVAAVLAAVLAGGSPGDIVLVTHGETIRAALAVLHGHPADRLPAVLPGNGEVLTARRAAPGTPWTVGAHVANAPLP